MSHNKDFLDSAFNNPEQADEHFMSLALEQGRRAFQHQEVPVGSVVVDWDGDYPRVLAEAHNRRAIDGDPTAHAEILAIREASRKKGDWRLTGTTLYVTIEPCPMCMGAILLARIDRVVFGCGDPKGGAAGSVYDLSDDPRLNHRVALTRGVREQECRRIMQDFFSCLRREHSERDFILKSWREEEK
ncbi:MAG: nucleoside deaminase [Deltaproteobacteria bacterium]|nr:nucleoside deaminase [Deltaproteobacteria bacterium]